MDSSHDWRADFEKPGDEVEHVDGLAEAFPTQGEDDEEARPQPRSPKWNSEPEGGKWLAHGHLASARTAVAYRIDGWLAERGTSVWFGAGSTGKTQLLLWMSAMIASRPEDRPEQIWLGGRIKGTGHVLILTAEDTREEIIARLRDVVTNSMGQDEAARLRTCSRLHVMPFLSMSEREFDHPNPSLLQVDKERVWGPSEVMLEIRRYIAEWNRLHPAPEEKIIGVVMDSATSMSGFDSLDAQATTNFFFYLGRLCERLRIFWAVIGHTPKAVSIPRKNARESAPSRLRGVAMWTTAPRLTIEVRLFQEWHERGKAHSENPTLSAWLDGRVKPRNLLVVYVAKANLMGASDGERYLARLKIGAFVDVTGQPDEVLRSGVLDACRDDAGEASVASTAIVDALPMDGNPGARPRRSSALTTPARPGRSKLDPTTLKPGTDLVLDLIREVYPAASHVGRVSANHLMGVLAPRRGSEHRAALVTSASGGGKLPARPGAINWHLDQLAAAGVLQKDGRFYHLVHSTGAASSAPDNPS